MKEINKNPLTTNNLSGLEGGDTVRDKDTNITYLVTRTGSDLRLHALDDGNVWTSEDLLGYEGKECMVKVEATFEVIN